MLNTDLRLGVPATDEDIVDHLIRHGVLSREMLGNLKAMKGFRNIVVYRYGVIDDALTFSILQEHIGDFALFRQEIEAFLRTSGCGGE
ncbi:type VII toxin-antitoxin system HepT family RNase toxin [Methanofollis fontis]|uniref:type VII toxin-antitoxin system HepT family RNase toxin n=1 Tax=Methanofollis fontis TaxID=2052832 RepID=UPI001F2EF2E1